MSDLQEPVEVASVCLVEEPGWTVQLMEATDSDVLEVLYFNYEENITIASTCSEPWEAAPWNVAPFPPYTEAGVLRIKEEQPNYTILVTDETEIVLPDSPEMPTQNEPINFHVPFQPEYLEEEMLRRRQRARDVVVPQVRAEAESPECFVFKDENPKIEAIPVHEQMVDFGMITNESFQITSEHPMNVVSFPDSQEDLDQTLLEGIIWGDQGSSQDAPSNYPDLQKIPVPGTPVPTFSATQFLQQNQLSPDTKLQFINNGYGFINPMAPSTLPPDQQTYTEIKDAEGNTRYRCTLCPKTFLLRRLVTRHYRGHSEIKRYLCMFCCKGFNDAFDLKRHTRTHTGIRPFRCKYCDRCFTQRCSLESHEKKLHKVEMAYEFKQRRSKIFVCEDCGNTSNDAQQHALHIKKNHPNSSELKKMKRPSSAKK